MSGAAVDVARLDKAELHCHIDGLLDPALLDELRADGHDFGLAAAELRARYPIDSLAAWERDYCAFVEPWLQPRAVRLPLLLERQLRRLKAQRVVYAEIELARDVFGFDEPAFARIFASTMKAAFAGR